MNEAYSKLQAIEYAAENGNRAILVFSLYEADYHERVAIFRTYMDEIPLTFDIPLTQKVEKKGPCSDSDSVLPWSVAAVALIIGVVSVICILRLWKAGQKTRAKNENSTYMSLQKTHPTSEYDVIHQL
ncbi:hypothetical protein D4764_10G0011610 [Takifugu flavidus]|uniref:Uncharacterized protein n=1 Tax=Takifugu flavidus TaxID=433684 RepID=A0A5C6PMP9_9TELE|nr:hypothetical protein D4764_10G0011610 [Takifugu flavidus]